MKRFRIILTVLFLVQILCTNAQIDPKGGSLPPPEPACMSTLPPTGSIGGGADQVYIRFTSSCSISANDIDVNFQDRDWLSASIVLISFEDPPRGQGIYTYDLIVTATPNTTGSSRTGNISINDGVPFLDGESIDITQPCAIPSVPPAPTITKNCGSTEVVRASNPTGAIYYWQTNENGEDMNDSRTTRTFTTDETVFLRAYGSCSGWSDARIVVVDVNEVPATPTMPIATKQCGQTIHTRATPPSGITWYWHTQPNDELDISNSSSTYTATTEEPLYLKARNNTSGCWSPDKVISVEVWELPGMPDPVTLEYLCDQTRMRRTTDPPIGITWYWQSSPTGTYSGTSRALDTFTVSTPGEYYLRPRNNNTNCWGDSRSVSVDIYPTPEAPSTPSYYHDCGKVHLNRGTPPEGVNWYWQGTNSDGYSTDSSDSYTVFEDGIYYIRAQNDITKCWSETSTAIEINVREISTPKIISVEEICGGDSYLTRGTPPSGIGWYWQTEENGTNLNDSSETTKVPGPETYYLRAFDHVSGCWGDQDSVTIGHRELPRMPIILSEIKHCGETEYNFEEHTNVDIYWVNAPGEENGTIGNLQEILTTGGEYYLRSKNNVTGCWSNTKTLQVEIVQQYSTPPPIPDVAEICDQTTISWTVQEDPATLSYYWNDVSTPENKNFVADVSYICTVEFTEDTDIEIRSKFVGTECYSEPTPLNVNVKEIPAIPGPISVQTRSCELTTIEMAQPLSDETWAWQTTHDGQSLTDIGLTYDVFSTGTYYLRAIKTGETECWSATEGFGVDVDQTPTVNVTTSELEVLEATTIELMASGAYNYQWFDDPTLSGAYCDVTEEYPLGYVNATPMDSITYSVIGYSPYGVCEDIASIDIAVIDRPVEAIITQKGNDLSASAQYEEGTVTYLWSTGETSSSIVTDGIGGYSIKITDIDGQTAYKGFDFPTSVSAPTEYNHIHVQTPLEEVTSVSTLNGWDEAKKNEVYKYFDGLGKPIQEVFVKGSPSKKDVVTFMEYDAFGRTPKEYLPFTTDSENGSYQENPVKEQKYFYSYQNNVAISADPYAVKVFDESPLNRVLKQGAPGETWQPGGANDHTIKIYTGKSVADDDVLDIIQLEYNVSTEGCTYNNLGANQSTYIKSTIIDENGVKSIEFKDGLGRVILKRVVLGDNDFADTYYVYDNLNRLMGVIPPKAVPLLITGNHITVNKDFVELLYFYKYDQKGRMIEKKLPGAKPIYMVYDIRDRIVLTQDGNMYNEIKWLFTKYDRFDRPILTGIYNSSDDRATLQEAADQKEGVNLYEVEGSVVHNYTNRAFPSVSDSWMYLTVTYYDKYYTDAFAYSSTHNINDYDDNLDGTVNGYFDYPTGLVTGTKTKVLNANQFTELATWLETTNFYDHKKQLIQTRSTNYAGGSDIISNLYKFNGNIERSRHYQNVNIDGITTTIIENTVYTYDHTGRVQDTKHYLGDNSDNAITISNNNYNEIGQLGIKKLHSDDGSPNSYMQSVDYRYNIRGWLTVINQDKFSTQASLSNSLFGMVLRYNNVAGIDLSGAIPQYNGNISAVLWKSDDKVTAKGYTFKYDKLNRLISANYGDEVNSWADIEFDVGGRTIGSEIQYDLNGNILELGRPQEDGNWLHQYDYEYRGNQLFALGVEGTVASTTVASYEYDYNGNMDVDNIKGLTVHYNHLNLPDLVSWGADDFMEYIYDASGVKLAQDIGAGDDVIHYVGNIVYNNGYADYLLHAEGRLIDPDGTPVYEYHLKDHLGNTRVAFDADASGPIVKQLADYYPFGLEFGTNLSHTNRYLYNGKEIQRGIDSDDNGEIDLFLDWYDYGARMYDPALGRWHVIDPLAEMYTPLSSYQYAGNNPIKNIDVNGEWFSGVTDWVDNLKIKVNEMISENNNKIAKKEARAQKLSDKGKSDRASRVTGRVDKIRNTNSQLGAVLDEIDELDKSSTEYHIDEINESGGGIIYDSQNDRIKITVGKETGLRSFSHEMKHAYQYETNETSFMSSGKPGLLYDITDEYQAFARSKLLGYWRGKNMTRYADKNYSATIPRNSINMTSKHAFSNISEGVYLKRHAFYSGIRGQNSAHIFKGWKQANARGRFFRRL